MLKIFEFIFRSVLFTNQNLKCMVWKADGGLICVYSIVWKQFCFDWYITVTQMVMWNTISYGLFSDTTTPITSTSVPNVVTTTMQPRIEIDLQENGTYGEINPLSYITNTGLVNTNKTTYKHKLSFKSTSFSSFHVYKVMLCATTLSVRSKC